MRNAAPLVPSPMSFLVKRAAVPWGCRDGKKHTGSRGAPPSAPMPTSTRANCHAAPSAVASATATNSPLPARRRAPPRPRDADVRGASRRAVGPRRIDPIVACGRPRPRAGTASAADGVRSGRRARRTPRSRSSSATASRTSNGPHAVRRSVARCAPVPSATPRSCAEHAHVGSTRAGDREATDDPAPSARRRSGRCAPGAARARSSARHAPRR